MVADAAARTVLHTDGTTGTPLPPARILVLETMVASAWLGPDSSGTGWLRPLLPGCRLDAAHAYDAGQDLPSAEGFDAVIVPGSIAAVYERLPWILRLEEYLRRLSAAGVPVLGICFGHQVLASALGGAVVRNPLGREMGFCDVRLTAAGREHPFLFAGLEPVFRGAQAHFDIVSALPAGATLLAESDYGIQSFVHGSALGMQFHPEMTGDALAAIAEHDARQLARSGIDAETLARELRSLPPQPVRRVVANFVAGVRAAR